MNTKHDEDWDREAFGGHGMVREVTTDGSIGRVVPLTQDEQDAIVGDAAVEASVVDPYAVAFALGLVAWWQNWSAPCSQWMRQRVLATYDRDGRYPRHSTGHQAALRARSNLWRAQCPMLACESGS